MPDNKTIKSEIFIAIASFFADKSVVITDNLELIGGGGSLDSMKLVELCLALEDKATNLGFDFDWTSDAAMSKSRGFFRTAGSLAQEFIDQMDSKK